MAYNFARRADIEATLKMIRAPKPPAKHPGFASREKHFASEGFVLKTPSGGIPARSGTTPGSADCTVWVINDEEDLIELIDSKTDEPLEVKVLNIFSSAVAGSVYITAKVVFNRLVVDAEDCG